MLHSREVRISRRNEIYIVVTKIKKTKERPSEGNPLVIDIEVGGKIIQMEIACSVCQNKLYWLSEDHSILYCGKCRAVVGNRHGDFVSSKEDITWNLT